MSHLTAIAGLLSVTLATTAHAQVSATITDLGRDGVQDLIDPTGNEIRLSQAVDIRYINEFDLPVSSIGLRWADLACQVAGPRDPPEARFECAVYIGDGDATADDFGRDAIAVFEVERTPRWDGQDELRVCIGDDLGGWIAAGITTIGVRIRVRVPHPSATYRIMPYEGRMLDTGQSCAPCAADFDDSGGVDGDDVVSFFRAWQMGANCADYDRSGGVDVDDIGRFFAGWQAGGC